MAASFYSTRKKERERKARRQEHMNKRGQRQMDEKDDPLVILKDDIEKIRLSLSDSSFTHRQRWRQTEDVGLPSSIRVCSKLKGKISHMSSMDSAEADKMAAVYDEFCKTINVMAEDHREYISHIYDDEEMTKKYYNKTTLDILELWTACSTTTVDLMIPLIKQYWENQSEFENLAKKIADTCCSCVKFTTVAVNLTKHPIPEDCGSKVLQKAAESLNQTADLLSQLIEAMVNTSMKNAEDSSLDMAMWLLFSIHHVAQNVLKQQNMQEESKEEGEGKDTDKQTNEQVEAKESTEVTESLNNLLTKLENLQMELNNQYVEKNEKDGEEGEKDDSCKNDQQAIDKFAGVYQSVVDEIFKKGKVTVCIEDPSGSDATIYYKPEVYTEVANCSLGSCPMKDRDTWLDEIPLTSDQVLVSDIYVVRNGPLKTSSEVEIDFTYIPMSSTKNKTIKVIAKQDGAWTEIETSNEDISDSNAHLSFKTNNLEAFTSYVEILSESAEVSPEGTTFTSEANPDVKVTFSEGLVTETKQIKIKVIPYDLREVAALKEQCPDSIRGIVSASDAVEIRMDGDCDTNKTFTVQVSMDDEEDPDTQLVVIRFNEGKVQVLDKSQCRLKKDRNLYLVETKGIWGIAVARIRKIFLNMRDTVKKEFQLIFGLVQLCNICTFLDDSQRNMEEGSFFVWIECIDKNLIREDVENKEKAGLIEVKQSRSKDITLRQKQTIILKIDGQIKLRLADPPDSFKITYLIGADNHVNIPMEVHRDQEKIPYASFAFHEEDSGNPFHTVNIPVRDLSELPTDEVTAKNFNKNNESNNLREQMKQKEEAAKKMLSHDSIMNLSRVLSERDGRMLGEQLGVDSAWIARAKDDCDGDILRTNFRVLCEWRGKAARSAMVDFLISSLKTIGRNDLSTIVTNVNKSRRGLLNEDFN
ncbi:uncharacterized protein LOC134262579 [Saccostrea cucullata]|uniref:uncharacterized protein LOC134262579 n=1 Tax=Saccostrea cuccullata TaxID=36930 RepID=UPI002ED3286D